MLDLILCAIASYLLGRWHERQSWGGVLRAVERHEQESRLRAMDPDWRAYDEF